MNPLASVAGGRKGLFLALAPILKVLLTSQLNTCLGLLQSKVSDVEEAIFYEKEHMIHPCKEKNSLSEDNHHKTAIT